MESKKTNVPSGLTQSAAEMALQPLLDAFGRKEYSSAELTAQLIDICTQQPAATWQALSLLDRYHRRDILSTALFRQLKKDLNAIAFGSTGKHALLAPDTQQSRSNTSAITGAITGAFTGAPTKAGAVERTAFDQHANVDTQFESSEQTTFKTSTKTSVLEKRQERTSFLADDAASPKTSTLAERTAFIERSGAQADKTTLLFDKANPATTRTAPAGAAESDRTVYLDDNADAIQTQSTVDRTTYLDAEPAIEHVKPSASAINTRPELLAEPSAPVQTDKTIYLNEDNAGPTTTAPMERTTYLDNVAPVETASFLGEEWSLPKDAPKGVPKNVLATTTTTESVVERTIVESEQSPKTITLVERASQPATPNPPHEKTIVLANQRSAAKRTQTDSQADLSANRTSYLTDDQSSLQTSFGANRDPDSRTIYLTGDESSSSSTESVAPPAESQSIQTPSGRTHSGPATIRLDKPQPSITPTVVETPKTIATPATKPATQPKPPTEELFELWDVGSPEPDPNMAVALSLTLRTRQTQSERQQQADLIRATLEKSPSLRPGVVLQNRYMLIEPLSSGGIGVVFRALDHQRSALPESERYVSIKCLHERLQDDPRAITALHHEFTQSQTLSHPNIARVYDYQQEGNLCFLAMELVDGESLGRICERIAPRRLPLPLALAIVREIGLALAHAHERGMVHGNLLPSNVVIARNGNVRVHEFGQATAWLESMSATTNDVTRLNLKSSPQELRYASPQQKKYVPVDPADDIYSLASIAFELLCGCAPDASVANATERKPRFAKQLTQQQWQTLQRGLSDDATQRGKDVRKWLTDLDLSSAAIRLPSLQSLESALEEMSTRTLPKWVIPAAASAAAVMAVALIAWFIISRENDSPTAPETIAGASTEQTTEAWNTASNETTAAPNTAAPTQSTDVQPATQPIATATPTEPTANASAVVDDAATAQYPTVGFAQSRYDVNANEQAAKLVIRRTGPTNRTLNLEWFTIEGAARPYIDYMGDRNTSLKMLPGQETAEIEIPLVADRQRDRATWFDVRIRATAAAMPGKIVVATVNLLPGSPASGK